MRTNNYKQPGDILKLTAPYARSAGEAALIGAVLAVAQVDVDNAAEADFAVRGVYELAAEDDEAAKGDPLFWKAGTKTLTTDPTAGRFVAVAASAQTAGDDVVEALLIPGASQFAEGQQATIVDLTDSTGLSGSHDDTLAATSVPADLTGGESPTEAEHNSALAVMRIMAQNTSDTAQKVKEIRAALVAIGLIASA